MPYIKKERRTELLLSGDAANTQGELNYPITVQVKDYLRAKGLSYQTVNDILGALDGASKEFYRRVAAPYEDQKIRENGDVY